jgi:hypothetical protein
MGPEIASISEAAQEDPALRLKFGVTARGGAKRDASRTMESKAGTPNLHREKRFALERWHVQGAYGVSDGFSHEVA